MVRFEKVFQWNGHSALLWYVGGQGLAKCFVSSLLLLSLWEARHLISLVHEFLHFQSVYFRIEITDSLFHIRPFYGRCHLVLGPHCAPELEVFAIFETRVLVFCACKALMVEECLSCLVIWRVRDHFGGIEFFVLVEMRLRDQVHIQSCAFLCLAS